VSGQAVHRYVLFGWTASAESAFGEVAIGKPSWKRSCLVRPHLFIVHIHRRVGGRETRMITRMIPAMD
jgi:hypothetical protein